MVVGSREGEGLCIAMHTDVHGDFMMLAVFQINDFVLKSTIASKDKESTRIPERPLGGGRQ